MSEKQPLRLLVLHSQPLAGAGMAPLRRLDLARERRELVQALQEGGCAVQVRFEVATPRRIAREISAGLDDRSYHIVVLSAHGTAEGELVLEGDDGRARLLRAEQYRALFPGPPRQPAAVLLCACHSGAVAPLLDEAGVKHVIAVDADHGIEDSAARIFAVEFIQTAGRGLPVAECVRLARVAVEHDPTRQAEDRFQLLEEQDPRHQAPIHRFPLAGTVEDHTPPLPRTNCHQDENRFVGRDEELAQVVQALDLHRLVTVTGAPGMGKSHLCREVGRWCVARRRFPDGVLIVDLQDAAGAGPLIERIGAALGFFPVPSSAGDLAARIGRQRSLLLLDNLEGTLGDAAVETREAVRALLRGTSELHLLVSSQADLGGAMEQAAEQVIRLDPLLAEEAWRLFLANIRDPGLDLDAPEQAATEQLLGFAGGMPLAIVLAAGQILEGTTPRALLERKRHCPDEVFSTGPGTPSLTERHGALDRLVQSALDPVILAHPGADLLFQVLSLLPGGLSSGGSLKCWDVSKQRNCVR